MRCRSGMDDERARVAEHQPARTPFLDAIDAGLLEQLGVAAEKPDLPRHRQLRLL